MIRSIILSTACRLLLPLLLLYSLYLLFRGHNLPGGGFVGGLTAAAGFGLFALANGVSAARRSMRLDPRVLVAVGLLTAVASGIPGLLHGLPFMSAFWAEQQLPVIGSVGTPLLFDTGVYLTVAGMALIIIFSLMED